MAVLKNDDNTEIIVNCDCGCENGIHIKMDNLDENTFLMLSYINGNFYNEQTGMFGTLKKKFIKIWAIIMNKDYCYSDIVMDKEDFQKFKDWINQF